MQLEDTVHMDADTIGHPPPSNRGASTYSNLPQSGMSQLEMENKIALLTSEVADLKKTIGDMRSHLTWSFLSCVPLLRNKYVYYLYNLHHYLIMDFMYVRT